MRQLLDTMAHICGTAWGLHRVQTFLNANLKATFLVKLLAELDLFIQSALIWIYLK